MLERRGLIHAFNKLKKWRVIAVRAPAGYGKTIAVTQWLDKDIRAKAIFFLDEYDNNLVGFCKRFCAALRDCQPQNQTLNKIISHDSFPSAPDEFSLNAIATLSGRKQTVLVIDDLHLIYDNKILKLLFVFIKRLPKNFQVILISRHDLPLEFSDLWLKEQATIISTEQFVFSSDEIKALYNKRGNPITQEQAEDIKRQTLGWAIGITAFMQSSKESLDRTLDYLENFVRANIWNEWDDSTRDFMVHTATLRELNPSLCEALTGVSYSDKFIKELVKKGAFITQLHEGVYCYHHLFQKFLQQMAQERGEEFVHSLLDIEGHWHLSKMDFYGAIDCFVQSKNHDGIAKCFDLLAGSGNYNFALGRLLPILEQPEFQNATKKYPSLLFLSIWGAYANGRVDLMVRFMDEYYARHHEILANDPSSAYKHLFMCIYDFRISPIQMTNMIGDSLVALSDISISQWSVSMHMPLLHRGLKDYSEFASSDIVDNCLTMQSKIGWLLGEEAAMLIQTLIAELLYEQGHLEKAHKHVMQAMTELKNHFLAESIFCAMATLAYVLDVIGEEDEVVAVVHSMSQMIEESKAYHLSHNFNAFIARRKIASGNIKAATEWLDAKTFEGQTLYGIYADITTCRAYIVIGKYDSAILLTKRVLEIASAFNRPLDILEARILLAIAYWKKKRGFRNEGMENLERAVRTAYPYGYVQMFVNDGAILAGMLYKLQKHVEQRNDKDKEYISFIKMLYLRTRDIPNIELSNTIIEKSVKLTEKQTAVMKLYMQGKTYKEICEILGVKQSTLRTHLHHIRDKLGVASIAETITMVNTMRLLDEHEHQEDDK